MKNYNILQKPPSYVYGDKDFLLDFRFTDKMGFPPSYIDFALNVGWGRLCGLFLVYIPIDDYPDSWTVQTHRIKNFMDTFYKEMEYDSMFMEPDGYEELPINAVPFAMSENGEYLIWDTTKRNEHNEFAIYVIASRMGGIRYGASDLYSFVENCTDTNKIKKMMGEGYSALPNTFEPLSLNV